MKTKKIKKAVTKTTKKTKTLRKDFKQSQGDLMRKLIQSLCDEFGEKPEMAMLIIAEACIGAVLTRQGTIA